MRLAEGGDVKETKQLQLALLIDGVMDGAAASDAAHEQALGTVVLGARRYSGSQAETDAAELWKAILLSPCAN